MTADGFFLALTVWKEARGEPDDVKLAVAYSILERAKNPKWWGTDIMSVVGKPWQYSSMTALHDPNLIQWPQSNDPSWDSSVAAASDAMAGTAPNPATGADSYFDDSISPPAWATPERFVARLGRLNFFDMDRS